MRSKETLNSDLENTENETKFPSFEEHLAQMQEKFNKPKLNSKLQELYSFCESKSEFDEWFQLYNAQKRKPFLITGQSGYFSEQIEKNGPSSLTLKNEDTEDAKFISECFGKKYDYNTSDVPLTYLSTNAETCLNYAEQSFPAGIFEDVLQCGGDHSLPMEPKVGEMEEAYWLRVLENKIDSSNTFDSSKKAEALERAQRLIGHFCNKKNRLYFIPIDGILDHKVSFGDTYLRNANPRNSKTELSKLPTLRENIESSLGTDKPKKIKGETLVYFDDLHDDVSVPVNYTYYLNNDANFHSEHGVCVYGKIRKAGVQYIEVEREYERVQRKAIKKRSKIRRDNSFIIIKNRPEGRFFADARPP